MLKLEGASGPPGDYRSTLWMAGTLA